MKIALAYSVFAIVATAANIASQDLSLQLYRGHYTVFFSVMIGTMAGLLVKYYLDKKYIFRFKVKSAVHDSRTFFLYSLMGILTTVIFWGFEFTFDYLYQSKEMRYLGGTIGLAIGYYIKYQLDKRFVFC